MRIDIITLSPTLFSALHEGICGRALTRKLLQMHFWNPRDYAKDLHRTVDDRPYGGGPGMVLQAEPIAEAIHHAQKAAKETSLHTPVIHLSPHGRPITQRLIQQFAQYPSLILLTSRYEGVDERLIVREVDQQWSLGDYILSNGELAAMVVIDAMARLLPNALGNQQSAEQDSFSNGLLDWPHYTRPKKFDNLEVPEVLMHGNHKAIARWRRKQALGRTWLKRFDLLSTYKMDAEQQLLLNEFIDEYKQNKNRE